MNPHSTKKLILILVLVLSSATTSNADRTVIDFDKEWKFKLGESTKANVPNTDDSSWRTLSVPHDWAFEVDYERNAAQKDRGGYKPGGLGWYRKNFVLPDGWQDKRISIHFDAVYMNSEVWINGILLGKRPYGYIPFHYDLTAHLKAGQNVIAVRVDSRLEPSARWYHGCGIIGHVKLLMTDQVAIASDGVFVRTSDVDSNRAKVLIDTEVVNNSEQPVEAILLSKVRRIGSDKFVGQAKSNIVIGANSSKTFSHKVVLKDPNQWSPESPDLYQVESVLTKGADDLVRTQFGVRTVRWETDTGFWLNGKNIKLLGVADHLEAGPVGAAVPDEINRWKIQLLKDMGCNAIRTAHNPQVPKFYELCDELGMLVMDEIFDGWGKKATHDYGAQAFAEWWERDLRSWLKANRNHPSVVVWSLGNETHGKVAEKMVDICHAMDATRMVTSGHSASNEMDVLGVNGASESRRFYRKDRPSKPFVATEAPHTWQVRGYYRTQSWFRDGRTGRQEPFPLPDLTKKEIFTYDWIATEDRKNRKQIFNSSYDNAMVRITARKNWELMRDLPWYSGHFRWTGFDYLGEAGYVHGGWPFRAFMGGALDLAGFKKDLYYFYQSQWTSKPMAHILPHWTHPRMELGTEIPVWVYSNCDEVELFLDGKSLGKDKPGTKWDEMQCDWMVPWKPGKLEAIGYQNGREVTRAVQQTAGAPANLRLTVEGKRNPIVTVEQVDGQGVLNPYAENRIHYHIDGSARILSLESGNPVNTENNTSENSRTAFFGLARCFLSIESTEDDLNLIAGAILGEKQQFISRLVNIEVKQINIGGGDAGDSKDADVTILYSTDGSKPSLKFSGPFETDESSTIKAAVYRADQLLFEMTERFAPDAGLHWSDGKEVVATDAGGDQAENAKYERAKIAKYGQGYNGEGFLDFGSHKGAFVEWYQENDGPAGEFELRIRYSGKAKNRKGRQMQLTVNGKEQELFFPNTKNYGSGWKNLKQTIELKSGANNIRLTTVERGGMCIDEISVK